MKDLSQSLGLNWEHGLNAGESMAGGNTTSHDSDNHAMKGPGSESVYPRPESMDAPDLQIDKPLAPPTTLTGSGPKPSDGGWATHPMQTGFKKAGE